MWWGYEPQCIASRGLAGTVRVLSICPQSSGFAQKVKRHRKLLSQSGQEALQTFKVVCVQYLPELFGASHCQLHVERCGMAGADQRADMSTSVFCVDNHTSLVVQLIVWCPS